jgi:hypothetical protein
MPGTVDGELSQLRLGGYGRGPHAHGGSPSSPVR